MSVASILRTKGDTVLSIAPNRPISEAADLLAEKKIGAVLVTDEDGGLCGILSERDIVRGLAARGASVMTQCVSDLMTSEVMTCTRSDGIDDIMRRMSDGRFRHMPVTERNKLVGVISIGDVVKSRIAELEHEASAMRDYIMTG